MLLPSIVAENIIIDGPVAVQSPQIVWPTMILGDRSYVEGDLNYFPGDDSYRERNSRGIGGAVSGAFRDAVRLARHRIWLFDEQILRNDESRDRLRELFLNTGASDIRVVTASKEGALERAAQLKELEHDLQNRTITTPMRIQFFLDLNKKSRELPDVHDRFAIIDDILWHCGATIGGLHNAINAMSFGWSATDTKAVAFFERLFRILDKNHV